MPRSFLVKKNQDELQQLTAKIASHVNERQMSSPAVAPVTSAESRQPSANAGPLRHHSAAEPPVGHQKKNNSAGQWDFTPSFAVPHRSFGVQQVAADSPGVVMPSTARELLAASWLAELQRIYYGGLVPLTTAAAAMASSPFPFPLPNVLLSLHGHHQQLQLLQPFQAAMPCDADRRTGEKLRGCTTNRPNDQSERLPVAGASNTGVLADSGRKTALTSVDEKARQPTTVAATAVTSVHRNRTGLNDFSIPSILARNDRFEGRRHDDDSGSTGSFNGATSGVDSEDAWSACTGSPSAEPETRSKLSNSSSDIEAAFDDDEDVSCPSTDRSVAPVATFGGMSDKPSMLLPSLFCFRQQQQQQHNALTASTTMRPLSSISPMSSSSYLSVSPPVCVRRPLQPCSDGHAMTGGPVKRRRHNQSADLLTSSSARIESIDGRADSVTRRQMMAPDSSSRQYECPQCDKVYSSIGALKMHIRTHTLPCQCPLCGKAFSRPWLLQGHLRTHTGERPFRCPQCDRAFADRSNLRAHLQTHADVKRYRCHRCSKAFSRASLLAKHHDGNCAGGLGLFPGAPTSGSSLAPVVNVAAVMK